MLREIQSFDTVHTTRFPRTRNDDRASWMQDAAKPLDEILQIVDMFQHIGGNDLGDTTRREALEFW